jgi:Zn-dependent protease
MISTQSGSLKLFRFAGVQVFLHWSWFVVAIYEISSRKGLYESVAWNVAEYVGLFAIVLMHEFGHALATRQTGGKAEEIILWPFGGIAFVNAPQRPGAQLWSIAAGPLVNVLLVPVLLGVGWLSRQAGWADQFPDFVRFLRELWKINLLLLVFNLLPVYPLDGGQLLRSLLWFPLGRARSLQVATVLGFVGIAGLLAFAFWAQSLWMGFITLFLGQQCLAGFKHSQALFALARMPRHAGFACPKCQQAPPGGPMWRCGHCGSGFDPFSTNGVCPHCGTVQPITPCAFCGTAHPIAQWATGRGDATVPPVIDV